MSFRALNVLFFPLFILVLTQCSILKSDENTSTGISSPLDPFEQNAELGRGINLGNIFEAPEEGSWGLYMQEEYFKLISSAGFESVRIPVRWSAHTNDSAPFKIDTEFLNRVEWAVDEALKNDLMVIINVHHYDEIFQDPAGEHAKFIAIWEQLSEHFQNKPSGLLFELLNEPHDNLTANLWNQLLPETLEIVRANNPYRTVVIGAAEWGGIPGLMKLQIPEDDNLIITVHYYEPFQFTHQGAEWVPGSDAWLGTTWDGTDSEVDEIKNHFDQIYTWAAQRNVPVNIGEFGAYRRADNSSRVRWTTQVVHYAITHDMSFHYWEFASGFGIYNPNTGQWNVELTNALINTE
ncbi:glycoside hydrolase family 5 protein [Balneola sp. MJW-20]|uniref:glycoside hydrolase family 5 protein n=1 Tax=Gracilimonas aurantiaca TaxID=3234185 RepID=UPI00390BBCF6